MTGKDRLATEGETIRAVRDGLVLFSSRIQGSDHDFHTLIREVGICFGKLISMAVKGDKESADGILLLTISAMAGAGLPVEEVSQAIFNKAVGMMETEGSA